MNLGDLHPAAGARKSRKRIGRGPGSGHGKTAGKGHKGHKARAGGGKPPGFEGGQMPLYRRLPKRGFKSRDHREFAVFNVGDIGRRFPQGGDVTPATLVSSGRRAPRLVKILGTGDLQVTGSLVVHAHAFSKSALEKIQATGGRAEVISA
jgi:large subunit ribosomal protein L15